MKKLILCTNLLLPALISFAQDVIVKTDGSTILAKVLKVGETEVEYMNKTPHRLCIQQKS